MDDAVSPLRGNVALADAGALDDPGVGGLDAEGFGQPVIGDDPFRQVAATAGDDGAGHHGGLNP